MQSLYYKAFSYIETSQPTHLGIYFSLFLHLMILLFAIGLPDFFKPKKIPIPQVIPIEILNISDVTSLTSMKEEIASALSTLTERERSVIEMYFGINRDRSFTLNEIGEQFSLTRERVRQIKEKAIRRLAHKTRSEPLRVYLGQ